MARGGTPYAFNSPSNTLHVITHNRNTLTPIVVIIDATTNEIITAEVDVLDSNTVSIGFPIAIAIRGKII